LPLPARAPQGVPFRVLFVCMGNICRSPTAEGVMRQLIEHAGLQAEIELDSAGTGSWHVGSAPDQRAYAAALAHGVVLEGAARSARREDFDDFDLVLAMDGANMRDLRQLAPSEQARAKIKRLREFDPASAETGALDVPDPYYGASGGFEEVFQIVHAACVGLLTRIRLGELGDVS
jgi:protein-tyrosine phosphatase